MTDFPESTVPAAAAATSYLENERLYHNFRKGMYMYPCDEVRISQLRDRGSQLIIASNGQAEKDRLDIMHQVFLVARRQELHRARIESTTDIRILDLGTGTGIWAIDMAE